MDRYDPDLWTDEFYFLSQPGQAEIQSDLFYDYRTNVPLYPEFQAFFRKHQLPTLVVWGKNDTIFPPEGAEPYGRDLPQAEISDAEILISLVMSRIFRNCAAEIHQTARRVSLHE